MIVPNEEFLAGIEVFRTLPPDLLQLVSELFQESSYHDDEFVFRASDPSKDVFVVKDGAVALFSDKLGEAVELKARLGPGSVFGEVGVLQGTGRTLSARASGATRLLSLEGRSLLKLAEAYDDLALELSKIALRYSFENRSSRVELIRRKEARIRLGAAIELRVDGREPVHATLENLSLGGACLSGLNAWNIDEATMMSFCVDPHTALLSVYGRVAWRRSERLGIAFTSTLPGHQIRVAGALHRLTREVLPNPV